MTEPELRNIWNLYVDLWKMFRQYHTAKTDEEYTRLTERANEIVDQYGEDIRSLVLDTLELIEKRCKG